MIVQPHAQVAMFAMPVAKSSALLKLGPPEARLPANPRSNLPLGRRSPARRPRGRGLPTPRDGALQRNPLLPPEEHKNKGSGNRGSGIEESLRREIERNKQQARNRPER